MKATFYDAAGVDMIRIDVDDQNSIVRVVTDEDAAAHKPIWDAYLTEQAEAEIAVRAAEKAEAEQRRDAAKEAKRSRRAVATEKQAEQSAAGAQEPEANE